MGRIARECIVLAGAVLVSCAADVTDSYTPPVGADGKADGWTEPPAWLVEPAGSGTWTVETETGVVHAWVDARVADLQFRKRVMVEVLAPYEGGLFMRTLAHCEYETRLGGRSERWGTDAVEIFPEGGPWGAHLAGPVLFRIRLQQDTDRDRRDDLVVTRWHVLYGEGEPVLPPDDPLGPGLDSPVRTTAAEPAPEALFSPFDDPGRRVLAEIDAVIARERAAPDERHTLHAAVFNIYDPEIVDGLIEAHRAGVEVRLVIDGRKLRPAYAWHTGDDRLLEAGVPVLGVLRPATGSMHDKIALFDGEAVATGSFNWEPGSRHENHENMVLSRDASLCRAYAARFEALAGGLLRPRAEANDPAAPLSVSFAPDEEPWRIAGRLIDGARSTVHVAMFTAKDVEYDEGGRRTSLLRKLIEARRRGVEVVLVVDHGIHEASEYHGIVAPDDPIDEWVESEGVHVVRADNTFGRYASMHHKFLVIDGAVTVTGAFNWYFDAAYRNDEDQLVIRDAAVARRFTAELVDLLRRYDAAFDESAWPPVRVEIEATNDRTRWGDTVLLVGSHPAAGSWSPAGGVALDGSSWPLWRGVIELPLGLRLEHKLAVRRRNGEVVWERGGNRLLTAFDGARVRLDYRH